MLSFRTSSARAASPFAGAILHLGRWSESGSAMKCGVVGIGAPGRIRTCTVLLLREPPPAVGLLAHLCAMKGWCLGKKEWCLRRGSNTRPAAYQAAAQPAELRRRT